MVLSEVWSWKKVADKSCENEEKKTGQAIQKHNIYCDDSIPGQTRTRSIKHCLLKETQQWDKTKTMS